MPNFQSVETQTVNFVHVQDIISNLSDELADAINNAINEMGDFSFGTPDNAATMMTAQTFMDKVIGSDGSPDICAWEDEVVELRNYIQTLIDNDILIACG